MVGLNLKRRLDPAQLHHRTHSPKVPPVSFAINDISSQDDSMGDYSDTLTDNPDKNKT